MTWEGQAGWNIAREEKAELCTGCWLVIFLSLFFITCSLMNETHTIATKETLKKRGPSKEQLCPNLSSLAIVYCYSSPLFCTNSHSSLLKSLSQPLPLFVSFSACSATFLLPHFDCPFSYSLSRHFAPSQPGYTQSLMHYRHSHQSWFCFTAERSRLSFWLHINCSVGTPGLLSTCLFSPLLYFSLVILYSLSRLSFHHSSECLSQPPHLLTSLLSPPHLFNLNILFLLSFLSFLLSCPLLLFHISLWCKLPTVGLTWPLYAETGILVINCYYCLPWWHPLSSAPPLPPNTSHGAKMCGSRIMCWSSILNQISMRNGGSGLQGAERQEDSFICLFFISRPQSTGTDSTHSSWYQNNVL